MTTPKSPIVRLCLFALLILATAGAIFAQSQATTGNIEGTVVDPNGALVPNVTVTATNVETGFQKTAQTNDDGTFVLSFLQPGNYKVTTAEVSGFAAATYENVKVTVGAKQWVPGKELAHAGQIGHLQLIARDGIAQVTERQEAALHDAVE